MSQRHNVDKKVSYLVQNEYIDLAMLFGQCIAISKQTMDHTILMDVLFRH